MMDFSFSVDLGNMKLVIGCYGAHASSTCAILPSYTL